MVIELGNFKKKNFDINRFSTIIFDLDNTLYNEIDYLKFAYKDISKKIVTKNNNLNTNDIFEYLLNTFVNDGRGNLYQKLIKNFNIKNFALDDFLYSLRYVKIKENSIKINQILERFIEQNIKNFNFCIATNGDPQQQRNKLKSINLPYKEKFFVVYCNELGKNKNKPSPAFINNILQEFDVNKNQLLFVGDSEIDEQAAINGNIYFILINDFISFLKKEFK